MFFKQFRSKFSQFEKPYLESEYTQMHLEWPTPDWPSWSPPDWPPIGPWSPALPGSKGPFPGVGGKMACVLHCWHCADCEEWVECVILAWGGTKSAGSLTVMGNVIEQEFVDEITVDIRFKLDSSLSNPHAQVRFIDEYGGVCFENVEMDCVGCDPLAVIGYTTLGMQVNEQQTLQALVDGNLDDDLTYTWAITSGGGSISGSPSNQVTYTAPSTNPNCADNATISLSCDGKSIDSITIAINEAGSTYPAYEDRRTCAENILSKWWVTAVRKYKCNDVAGEGWHVDESCERDYEWQCIADCNPSTIVDLRTEAMLAAGCCPEKLL